MVDTRLLSMFGPMQFMARWIWWILSLGSGLVRVVRDGSYFPILTEELIKEHPEKNAV